MSTTTHRGRRAARGVKTATSTAFPTHQTTTGTYRAHPRGFGFVEFTDPLTAAGPAHPGELVHTSAFVPPPLARTLLTDDRVEVSVDLRDGRATATKVTVTHRSRTTVFGRLERRDGKLVLVPDTSVGNRNFAVNGKSAGARPGNWATLDLGTGTIVETYRHFGPLAARAMLFHRAMLPLGHSDQVEQAAARCARAVRTELAAGVPAGRADLRAEHTVTIDGPTSKDLDDAIAVHPTDAGLRVHVHIADVAAAVETGGVIDESAYEVGTSVYLPSWNRPMLPRTLSEQALSLLPGVERNAVTVAYTVSESGAVSDVEVFLSRIVSNSQLTYEATSNHLDGTARLRGADATTLERAARAGAWLGRERDTRLTVRPEFATRELRAGVTSGDYAAARFTSFAQEPEWSTQMLIERLMVAANEAVAGWLGERNLPGVFRTHDAPGADLAADLAAFVSGLPRGQRAPLTARTPHDLVLEARQRPDARTGPNSLLLRNLDRAQYVPQAGHHFGLASEGYLHFTSPLRRYADLFVHRVIHAYLADDAAGLAELAAISPRVCEHLTVRTGVAARTEAGFVRCASAAVHAAPGRVHQGHVTEFTTKGVVVTLPETGMSGVVPFETLSGGSHQQAAGAWATDPRRVRATHPPTGNVIMMGAPLRVTVAEVDVETGSVTLSKASRRR